MGPNFGPFHSMMSRLGDTVGVHFNTCNLDTSNMGSGRPTCQVVWSTSLGVQIFACFAL
jgi:hypothetical protein